MEVLKCNVCGVNIGGQQHRAEFGIQDIDEKLVGDESYYRTSSAQDSSPLGYCLKRVAAESNPLSIVRSLPPLACRLMRFLLHVSLSLGCMATASTNKPLHALIFDSHIKNTEHAEIEDNSPALHFVRHARMDWDLCVQNVRRNQDDVVTLVHRALERSVDDASLRPIANSFTSRRLSYSEMSGAEAQAKRNDFEQLFAGAVVKPIFSDAGIDERLTLAVQVYKTTESDEGAAFVAELQEKSKAGTSVEHVDPALRTKLLPALWRFRQRFSLADMMADLNPLLQPETAAAHPVLSFVLTNEAKMRGLPYMPHMYALTNLLLNKYSRRLDRDSARTITIKSELQHAANSNPRQWALAYDAFSKVFNHTWRHVERYGWFTFVHFRLALWFLTIWFLSFVDAQNRV